MKICVISNLYEPYVRGGAEEVAKIMAKGFQKLGHEVVVVSTKPEVGVQSEENDQMKIYRFRPMNLFYYLNDFQHNFFIRLIWRLIDIFNYHSYWTINKILQKEKPDLVITHNLVGLSYLLPRLIRKHRIKYIHVLHDVQLAVPSGIIIKGEEKHFLNNGFLIKIHCWVCNHLFGSPETVISPSKWLMEFYVQRGFFKNSKQIVLPNPIKPVDSIQVKEKKNNRYLFIGQLEKHKGIDWLINFWKKNNIKDELWIVGLGSLSERVENEQAESIKYLGCKRGRELGEIFKQVDFLIVPSLCYENSPSVITLAFQNATPVMVANIGGAAELVENRKAGFVFEAGSEESLLNALNEVNKISDIEYQEMSRECLVYAGEFIVDNYLNEILKET
ncbi:MAG: glycosyltransferase [Patescibacteria group bacterium]